MTNILDRVYQGSRARPCGSKRIYAYLIARAKGQQTVFGEERLLRYRNKLPAWPIKTRTENQVVWLTGEMRKPQGDAAIFRPDSKQQLLVWEVGRALLQEEHLRASGGGENLNQTTSKGLGQHWGSQVTKQSIKENWRFSYCKYIEREREKKIQLLTQYTCSISNFLSSLPTMFLS